MCRGQGDVPGHHYEELIAERYKLFLRQHYYCFHNLVPSCSGCVSSAYCCGKNTTTVRILLRVTGDVEHLELI